MIAAECFPSLCSSNDDWTHKPARVVWQGKSSPPTHFSEIQQMDTKIGLFWDNVINTDLPHSYYLAMILVCRSQVFFHNKINPRKEKKMDGKKEIKMNSILLSLGSQSWRPFFISLLLMSRPCPQWRTVRLPSVVTYQEHCACAARHQRRSDRQLSELCEKP